jgi:energy-coupling factor transporter ATP-binding protein EcfA2
MINQFKTEKSGLEFDFDVEFDKNQKIHCIIGKNGIGKTQLLENMAKALIFRHSIFSNKYQGLEFSGFFTNKIIGDKLKKFDLSLPIALSLNTIKIKDKYKNPWGHTTFEKLKNYSNKDFICDKPIIFIGAKNRGFSKNIDPDNIKILANKENRFVESITRTMAYINAEGLEHEEIANWFVSRLIINPNFVIAKQNKSHEVITVLKLIEKLEPSYKLVIPNENGANSIAMLYHEGQLLLNAIPLDKLSTGFISIIKIFQEIVAGYGGWSNLDDLSQVDGIVFIDEIEPHLHLSWQTKIISILREAFPKTTFYITTHSPLVLAGLKEGEAYELYKNEEENLVKTKRIEKIENYFLNDIVSEFFAVDLNKQRIENVDKEKQKKGKKALLNLLQSMQEDK